jgi:hypothetical protein
MIPPQTRQGDAFRNSIQLRVRLVWICISYNDIFCRISLILTDENDSDEILTAHRETHGSQIRMFHNILRDSRLHNLKLQQSAIKLTKRFGEYLIELLSNPKAVTGAIGVNRR